MNAKQMLERFEIEVFPLMEPVKQDAAHINAFLIREIGEDKEFLFQGINKRYSGDKASYDSIRFLRKLGIKSESVSVLLTDYYLMRAAMSKDEIQKLDKNVWLITSLFAEQKLEEFKSIIELFKGTTASEQRAAWIKYLRTILEEFSVSSSKSTDIAYVNREIKKILDGKSGSTYSEEWVKWLEKADLNKVKTLIEIDISIMKMEQFIRDRILRLAANEEVIKIPIYL